MPSNLAAGQAVSWISVGVNLGRHGPTLHPAYSDGSSNGFTETNRGRGAYKTPTTVALLWLEWVILLFRGAPSGETVGALPGFQAGGVTGSRD